MAAKNLTTGEMVQVTRGMLHTSSEAWRVMLSDPVLSALVPVVREAHDGVVAFEEDPDDSALRALTEEATQRDADHDRFASGVYTFITGRAELSNEPALLLDLRGTLFRDGPAGATQITYRDQAGTALRLRREVTPEQRDLMRSMPIDDETLLDKVEAWWDAADRLGEIERERQQREKAIAEARAEGPRARDARFRWIRVINLLRETAEVVGLPAAQYAALFGELDEMEATADQRRARRVARSDVAPKHAAETDGSDASQTG